jgi:hypothetical protein
MRSALAAIFLLALPPDDPKPEGPPADPLALRPFAGLVGEWRGTGQVRRGSARGAWVESAEWRWDLGGDPAALVLAVEGGRHLRAARLTPDAEPGRFRLVATLPDGAERVFAGAPDERGRLVLVPDAEDAPDSGLARVTLTPLHAARFLLLLESAEGGGRLSRLGEVGYTRQGVRFAAGDGRPACVVTGGRGTTKVEHDGREYWVCCSGCKALFEADPEGVLADAAERARDDR